MEDAQYLDMYQPIFAPETYAVTRRPVAERIEMQAVGADLWQITFTDVPIAVRLSLRVSDPNVCIENPTGAATRNVSANDVPLVDVVPTPGSGTEPGLAFTVAADGTVTP